MKKGLILSGCICFVLACVFGSYSLSYAQPISYTPLTEGFPELKVAGEKNIVGYFNAIFKLVIGLTGILAVIMIIVGGIQYVSTDAWTEKDHGKKRIQAAIGGLILALSSFLILNTIDPSLTNLNFTAQLKEVELPEAVPITVATTDQYSTVDYDLNESESLDPTGTTGNVIGDTPAIGQTSIDTCEGLSDYRSSGLYSASDKGGTSGSVVGEIAWLMKAVPQKWPGLRVMSSYRSLKWNLISAYNVPESKANQVIADFEKTDGSYSSRVTIATKYGLPRAALTSNHILGEAVDFAGPGLGNGEADQLEAWARSNNCLRIPEVLWREKGHYDHIHLGI